MGDHGVPRCGSVLADDGTAQGRLTGKADHYQQRAENLFSQHAVRLLVIFRNKRTVSICRTIVTALVRDKFNI